MYTHKLGLFVLMSLVVVSLITVSCSEITPAPTDLIIEEPYPITTQDYSVLSEEDSAYPASVVEEELKDYYPEEVEIPEPSDQTGVVVGRLLLNLPDEPYLAPGIYLGKEISNNTNSDESLPSVISISPGSDPLAIQAQDGTFMFSEIEPGEYRIFLWSPMSLVLLKDVASSEEIVVFVTAGEITNLGDILVE